MMKLNYIKVESKLGKFLVASIDGKLLQSISRTDIRKLVNGKDTTGLQRKLKPLKVREITEYVDTSYATFPNSIILKADSTKVRVLEGDTLEFDESKNDIFTIIDGQHRVAAFDKSIETFDVLVSIFLDIDNFRMVELFKVINCTQSPVNPSLRAELESEIDVLTPEKFSVDLVKRFNYDTKSKLFRRIDMYGDTDEEDANRSLSLHAFNGELLKLIYNKRHYHLVKDLLLSGDFESSIEDIYTRIKIDESKYILWKYYSCDDSNRLYTVLSNYFEVISLKMNHDWQSKKSLLLKAVGFRALMLLFVKVYNIGLKEEKFTKDFLSNLLDGLAILDGKINSEKYTGTSESASKVIYRDLLKACEIK